MMNVEDSALLSAAPVEVMRRKHDTSYKKGEEENLTKHIITRKKNIYKNVVHFVMKNDCK